jgi:Domain of unknown function (DUF4372)/Transposase DDE domain
MHSGKTVFSQVVEAIHQQQFARCVERYGGDRKVRHFSCWDQFLCMAFAQLTYRESLRDIENTLGSRAGQLYRMGFRTASISRSTLSDANEVRDWRMYADLGQKLIAKARRLYGSEDHGLGLKEMVYVLDSSTVDLCLSLFRWARFRTTKSAIKLHTLLDLRGPIPSFVEITDGKFHDSFMLDALLIEPGAFYVMDRGYMDFARLCHLHRARAYFVIRGKANLSFRRHRSLPVDRSTGLRSDHIGVFRGHYARKDYPEPLRRVRYHDLETQKTLVFLTNHMSLDALTVCDLYKSRWQVELFFKWIKGHLRIKAFYGTSANAVKTQVWIAICVYLLIAILKKELGLPQSLHSILQVLSVNPFEKVPIDELLTKSLSNSENNNNPNQLLLWDL